MSSDKETVSARPEDKEEESMEASELSQITKDFDKISVSVTDVADTEMSKNTKKKPEMVDLTTSSPTKGSMVAGGSKYKYWM